MRLLDIHNPRTTTSALKVTAKVYNLDMVEKFSKEAELSLGPDSSTRAFTVPAIEGLSPTYFVSLTLETGSQSKSRNFYWHSTREETIDWSKQEEDPTGEYDISTWSPTKTFADYTGLNTLPQIDLDVSAKYKKDGQESSTTVTVHKPDIDCCACCRTAVSAAKARRTMKYCPWLRAVRASGFCTCSHCEQNIHRW